MEECIITKHIVCALIVSQIQFLSSISFIFSFCDIFVLDSGHCLQHADILKFCFEAYINHSLKRKENLALAIALIQWIKVMLGVAEVFFTIPWL